MNDAQLRDEAQRLGISPVWQDFAGNSQYPSPEVLRDVIAAMGETSAVASPDHAFIAADVGHSIAIASRSRHCRITFEDGQSQDLSAEEGPGATMHLPAIDRPGYHRLDIDGRQHQLAIAPKRCWTIADATHGHRRGGLAVQLYSLRRQDDPNGPGDFVALGRLAAGAAAAGLHALAISPVHALFSAWPGHFSPYSPSSRTRLNALYADLADALPQAGSASVFAQDDLLNWPQAAHARLQIARARFDAMQAQPGSMHQVFQQFRTEQGEALQHHAVFEALHAARLADNPEDADWRRWPAALRSPHTPEVRAFAQSHTTEIAFHAFLQFMAEQGLAQAQSAAKSSGMEIGLITDVAVGVSPFGSDAWSRQSEMLGGLTIGAPPDLLNTRGQNWGVTTFSPTGLISHGYRSLTEMLRSALRHAGGMRLDHVMGLGRLWVVPEGRPANEGTYVHYPIDDIMRLVKLESWRHRAIVLGEDLGTVPEGFRERMDQDGMAGMRVLWLERDGEAFSSPKHWPEPAVAMTSTHDLPTVVGWWGGRDIAWRDQLGDTDPQAQATRDREREALCQALAAPGSDGSTAGANAADDVSTLVQAVCNLVASSGCGLALLPAEDAMALPEQPNLPGTIDEHPNWRRRMTQPVETMLSDPAVAARLHAFAERAS